ncbi:MAG: FAD-binding oxidoreductase [Pyrinomonadaceae bacterium]
MLTKSQPDEIQDFLIDASHMHGGYADRIVLPENAAEIAKVLAKASASQMPVTVSGAGTGTVGGRVPFGGIVLATDRLNRIKSIVHENGSGRATAEAGVMLSTLQKAVEAEKLFYPPDPTEGSCFLGGTVATNASGARTFKYGPTRNYVERLQIVLATGEMIDLRRGELRADAQGQIKLPLSSGRVVEAQLPSYQMPPTRKHAAAYYVAPGLDVLDLFIGSEGTLGVIVEIEVKLIPQPLGLMSAVVFFEDEANLLTFVQEVRRLSLLTRAGQARTQQTIGFPGKGHAESEWEALTSIGIDARALEYFDHQSLGFLRQKYPEIPEDAVGAIFFEQETTSETEDDFAAVWFSILQANKAMLDQSWFATNVKDQARLREFRHQLPVLMNEWFARYDQQKVSTDMAVPDEEFPGMLRFYQDTLRAEKLKYTIFGHIGDNHVHVNILPRDDNEGRLAREIYLKFIRRAVAVGGTISAEHGIGKLKRQYLGELYGENHLREMAALKRAFDPAGILGRGNIFADTYL